MAHYWVRLLLDHGFCFFVFHLETRLINNYIQHIFPILNMLETIANQDSILESHRHFLTRANISVIL